MRVAAAPHNDSGGFSLISADAVAAIVRDDRQHDRQFVDQNAVLLFNLVGDDQLNVRVVLDEPISDEESRALLSRVSGLLDLRGGTLLVCGGFDPRSLDGWRKTGSDEHVVAVSVAPGWYRVVVGATLASMNGQAIAAGGEDAWHASPAPPVDPRPDFGWLVALERMQGSEITVQELTLPDESGWFALETGVVEAWKR
jgi:hypothetical protein